MISAYNINTSIISILRDSSVFLHYSIFPMFDVNIEEKPNRASFIGVGIKSYEIGEKIVSEDEAVNGKRKYKVEVKINFYSRYSSGAEYCYRLFDFATAALFNSSLKTKIKSYECTQAVYRRDIDSIVVESILTFEDFYT